MKTRIAFDLEGEVRGREIDGCRLVRIGTDYLTGFNRTVRRGNFGF